MQSKRDNITIVIAGYLISLFFVFFIFNIGISGIGLEFPSSHDLLVWDGAWYHSIVDSGYHYNDSLQSNAGFFPLFPLIWRLSGLNAVGISICNLVFFLSGFIWLFKVIQPSTTSGLLVLSLPSLFFFYVPYSESLFYLFGVLFIVGYLKNNNWMIVTGCILLSLVRPAFFFLIPAVIGVSIFKRKTSTNFNQAILIFLSLIIGTVFGFATIGYYTGDFFAYSKAQTMNWGHFFSWPNLPLTTWRGYRILWLDAFALSIGISAVIILTRNFLKQKNKIFQQFDKIEMVAVLYTIMILVYVLFFHPKEDGRTTLLSLNRYVFCNPFLHYILLKRLQTISLSRKHLIMLSIVALITIVLIGFPYTYAIELTFGQSMIFFIAIAGFIVLQALSLFKLKWSNFYFVIIYVNIVLQAYLFQSFLKGNWIG